MQILKFGGASVKDAQGVKNLKKVLEITGTKETLIIASAMGKTTNALEKVIQNYYNAKHELQSSIQEVKKYHNCILLDLFEDVKHPVFEKISKLFEELNDFYRRNKSPNYNFIYDQTIGYGELVSTTIISYYLNDQGVKNTWMDVRELIKTNKNYRNAKVKWDITLANIKKAAKPKELIVSQGFIASDDNNFTTTLGREGSDYSAAIFAYCLSAKSVTVWKDVPGILNADPRYFENSTLLKSLSYEEAIELSYYGASVIHPKTLQPLKLKEIPLHVKSFTNPNKPGTIVGKGLKLKPNITCYTLRKNQTLLTVSSLDFSYIMEENIIHIFNLLELSKMKINLVQNSAISFNVCVENNFDKLDLLSQQLKAKYNLKIDKNVNIFTLRNYTTNSIIEIEKNRTVLLKQITSKIVQIVTDEVKK